MANTVTSQIIIDGDRNLVIKLTGILDTSNEAYNVKLLPTGADPVPAGFRIDHIDYSISDPLEVQLFWDATVPTIIQPLAGRGRMSFHSFGGLQNNSGAGKTGGLGLSTSGYTAGTTTYSLVLELVKQWR